MKRLMIATALLLGSAPAFAQDLENAEVMVTAQRIEQDDYSNEMPAVGLRKTADFLVQEVVIRGDTREPKQRAQEIRTMLTRAVKAAGEHGVQLAYGDYVLTSLTPENVDELTLSSDSRPDSERVSFLVKAPLGGTESGAAAQARIRAYIKSVPEVGRAQMDESGDSSLSIVGPDKYRTQITGLIAADANALVAQVGSGYAVEMDGLNMPVQWSRSGPAEVMLYIPYKLRVVPKP